MGVNLSKGQTVNLTKQGGGSLSQVRMGLGWDVMKKKGLFGGMKEVSVDLDASALLMSADRQVLEIVYYGNLRSKDGSLMHTGDNLTGNGRPAQSPAGRRAHHLCGEFVQRAELLPDRERDRAGGGLRGPRPRTCALRTQRLR